MRDFNEQIVPKIRQWAEIPPRAHCGAVLLRGMSSEFAVKILLAESGTIWLLQWVENCSITSSN
jgi:hypothetical protein